MTKHGMSDCVLYQMEKQIYAEKEEEKNRKSVEFSLASQD